MAVRTISTKLAIEGEAEYKKSIQNINSALSTLKSELKLVESNFQGQANSYAALEAKGSVLADMYDEQAKKLSATKEALEKWQEVQRKCADEAENAKASVEKLEKELAALGEESDGTGVRRKSSRQPWIRPERRWPTRMTSTIRLLKSAISIKNLSTAHRST